MTERFNTATSNGATLALYRRRLATIVQQFPASVDTLQLDLFATLVELKARPLHRPSPVPFFAPPAAPAEAVARDLVAAPRARLLLLGGLGAGKTTTLRALALACAVAAAATPDTRLPLPESWHADPPLPLLLDGALLPSLPRDAAGPALLDAWLLQTLELLGLAAYLPELQQALRTEPCLVLIDNVDALAPSQLHDLLATLNALAPDLRVAAAGRNAALAPVVTQHNFAVYQLQPLDLPQIDHMAGLWYQERARVRDDAFDPTLLRQLLLPLQAAARAHPDLRALMSQPLLLRICLAFHAAGLALPRERPRLYERVLAFLAGCDDAQTLIDEQPGLRHYHEAQRLLDQHQFAQAAYTLRAEAAAYEPLRLSANMLARHARHAELYELFCLLLADAHGNEQERQRNGLLAAELLLELNDLAPFEPFVATSRARLLEALDTVLLPRAERIRAGHLLGHLGDARTAALLPDTVAVAGGVFLFGDDHGHYEDEGPPNWVELPPFAIGRHPVTNRDYGRFLAANPQHPSPYYWHDPAYNNPSQPVVGVTWHDAQAYCQWLTLQLHESELLPFDQVVRLPREAEWEQAASWDSAHWKKQVYPWGDNWDAQRANTADERGDWTVAPIGCFPNGRSPCGAHDLVGNVWEWTLDEYRSYPGASRPFYEPNTYVLRGSSCQSLASNARCTYRNRLPPSYWRNHIGFRIVVGPPV